MSSIINRPLKDNHRTINSVNNFKTISGTVNNLTVQKYSVYLCEMQTRPDMKTFHSALVIACRLKMM